MTGIRSQRSMKRGPTPTTCLQWVTALFQGAFTLIIRLPSIVPLQLDLSSFVSDVGSQISKDTHVDAPLVPRPTFAALMGQNAVAFRPPVAKELPNLADFQNHVQVKIRHQHFILVAAGLG